MPKRRENNTTVPKIYVDTCILQGGLSGRNKGADIVFLNKCKDNGWKVYSSIHTLMELFDLARERAFLMKSVIKKWVDVNTFLRDMRRMTLNNSDLDDVSEELNKFFLDNKFIDLVDINEEIWTDVKRIVETSNLHSSDALHLALARMYQCQVLVTHDGFFIEEGNRILKEVKEYNLLRICDIGKVEQTINALRARNRKASGIPPKARLSKEK